ncbi:hypothetical protein BOX15_Mlig029695g1 [Macrostomum lignano]|uniref:SIPAR domain-containing protein n=1 Tax=Macrostomum lignano TaxID=282301 RepID=A0A267ENP0_9PLAT|nr:hypothetical protein BOX15_Mlig029695g1 [Macrostomum lignano]
MSRGVKDLRELICVSRLAGRGLSDNSADSGDSDDNEAYAASILRPDTVLSARHPPLPLPPSPPPPPPAPPQAVASSAKARAAKKLPPVQPDSLAGLLARADADFIARLLGRANDQLADLSRWCLSDDHFVDLAHFWLTAFPEEAKQDLFRLEHGCLLDQLAFAFKSGTAAAAPVPQSELRRLLLAVFREFPDRLLSARGAHTFLDYLDTLTAGRSHADCRRLLTDVRLATDVRQHAEWLLALRSFAICSVWTAVANFYRALVDRGDFRPPATEVPGFGDRLEGRVVRCVQQGYVEVLHYFCLSGKLDPRTFRDGQSRNLIFLSVTCAQRSKENSAQLRTLRYLLKRLQPDPPVDVPSDTGNSALHLAATAGNLQLAELLVQHGRANVNLANALCDSCTPLHLAVMYGHSQLVSYLLEHGADPSLPMAGQTALQLAEDAGDSDIHELLARATAAGTGADD